MYKFLIMCEHSFFLNRLSTYYHLNQQKMLRDLHKVATGFLKPE